jgi:hypothetical protein
MQAQTAQAQCPLPLALLYERILAAALAWFAAPVAYVGGWSPADARCLSRRCLVAQLTGRSPFTEGKSSLGGAGSRLRQ